MKWKDDDLNLAISLIKDGKSYSEISLILKRSEGSIRSKVIKYGVKTSLYYNYKVSESVCLFCGDKFEDLECRERKFCSQSCNAKFNNVKRKRNVDKITSNCPNCSKEITKRNNKYCDNKCQLEYERKLVFEKIESGDTSLYEKNYKNYLVHKYGERCMKCGWCERNKITGKVPIQLEHKDGNSYNNSLNNLELLCPNCHSLTPTYGALNKGNGRKNRKR